MAVHPRTAIRQALAAAMGGLPSAPQVFPDPVYDIEQASLPAIVIDTGDEQVDAVTSASHRVFERRLTVGIEAIVRAASGLDDALDALALEIEAAIHADVRLGGAALDTRLTGIRREIAHPDQPLGRLRLEYEIIYSTEA